MQRKVLAFLILCCFLITTDAFAKQGKITFLSQSLGRPKYHPYIMNADGSDVTRLMDLIDLKALGMEEMDWGVDFPGPVAVYSLSPDCRKIAFAYGQIAKKGELIGRQAIYIMDLESRGLKKALWDNIASFIMPRWSPDGRKIVCVKSSPRGDVNICVADADGSNLQKVIGSSFLYSPDWSPDGRKIAFFGGWGGRWNIYTMDLGSGDLTNITKNKVTFQFGHRYLILRWSPDGRRIAFGNGKDIYITNSDGTNLKKLTDSEREAIIFPCWSPNGRKIAFTSNRDGVFHIYVMNPDGTDQRRLTSNEMEEAYGIDWRSPLGIGLGETLLRKTLWGKIKLGH
jgi:Tol biopolymer transport system component